MCENIKIEAGGQSYENAMLDAMTRCKNFLSETEHVFRSPDQCGQGDWFLAHSDTDRSLGGGLIGGMFIFSRNWEEDE